MENLRILPKGRISGFSVVDRNLVYFANLLAEQIHVCQQFCKTFMRWCKSEFIQSGVKNRSKIARLREDFIYYPPTFSGLIHEGLFKPGGFNISSPWPTLLPSALITNRDHHFVKLPTDTASLKLKWPRLWHPLPPRAPLNAPPPALAWPSPVSPFTFALLHLNKHQQQNFLPSRAAM